MQLNLELCKFTSHVRDFCANTPTFYCARDYKLTVSVSCVNTKKCFHFDKVGFSLC